ncbi:MAG: hypothetical protein QOG45_1786 [Chloroflexota bacterium]|jgi:hypothetical protein|nr:hypothetical protein [Chloroflexota bacterium]
MRGIVRGRFTHGCAKGSVVTTASAARSLPAMQLRGWQR